MSDWKPLWISLIIIFFVGGLVPFIIAGFIDEGQYDSDSYVVPIITFVQTGFDVDLFWIFDVNLDPFSYLPDSWTTFLISQLNAFSYVPNWITAPIMALALFGFIYTVIKMVPIPFTS